MIRISVKKQREINLSSISLTGDFASIKNNATVNFESSLERDYIYLLEYDTRVMFYYEQPIKITFEDNGKNRYYIPDFFVEYKNGNKEIIEIKYENDLIVNKLKYQQKFKAAKHFCHKNGISFRILTENDIRTEKLFNAKFLTYYQNPSIDINYTEISLLYDIVKQHGQISVKDIITAASKDENRQAELLFMLWTAVAKHFINFKEGDRLSMNSILFINK